MKKIDVKNDQGEFPFMREGKSVLETKKKKQPKFKFTREECAAIFHYDLPEKK